MKIRFASTDDLPACVELGRQLHQLTRFTRYQFQPERVASQLRTLIETGQNIQRSHCMLLAENQEGLLCGALIACIERHIFSDQPVASVISFGVLPQARMGGAAIKLLLSFQRWADKRGAFEINLGVSSGLQIEKTGRLMQRLGFVLTGGNYVKSLA